MHQMYIRKWEDSQHLVRFFPLSPHFQLQTVHRADSDRAPAKIARLKGISDCEDKQVATEDINCFISEQSHMAEATNKRNKTGH